MEDKKKLEDIELETLTAEELEEVTGGASTLPSRSLDSNDFSTDAHLASW